MENTFGINIIPENDQQRVAVLKRYKILDTPSEDTFNHIAKLAAQIFNTPIALISLVDSDRVFFKANIGMGDARHTPRGRSLCSLAILQPEVTVFENAPQEPCLLSNPLVAGEFGLKFYAGAPLVTHDGFLIGTLCIVDKKTRAFSDQNKEILKGLAQVVMDGIELRLSAIEEAENQNRTKARLAESEYKTSHLISEAPVAIGILTGKDLFVESANDQLLKVWGKDKKVIGLPLHEALPELKGQPYLQLLEQVRVSGNPYYGSEAKVMLERNNRTEEAYFNFVYHPLKDELGKTNSIMVVANEITEQIQIRRQIQESERKLQNLIMTAPVGMTILRGRDLIVEMANQPMYDIWNRSAAQILGKSLMSEFPELEDQPFPKMLESVFNTGETVSISEIEVEISTPEGFKNYYVDFKYSPMFDLNGEVEAIMATVNDITEIVHSRKALEESEEEQQSLNEELSTTVEELAAANEELMTINEELASTHEDLRNTLHELEQSKDTLRMAIEDAGIAIWSVYPHSNELMISDRGKLIHGIPEERQLSFSQAMDLIAAEYREQMESAIGEIIDSQQGSFNEEYMINPLDETPAKWLRTSGKAYLDKSKRTYVMGTLVDITEQKLDEIRKNDFIAMVSHELKTPLTSLKGYIQLLMAKSQKNEDAFATGALDKANTQVKRMTAMINGFLNVGRLDTGKIQLNKHAFDFSELVHEIADEIAMTHTSHKIKVFDFPHFRPEADRDKIGQVINNFLSNAIKYSPQGKDIELSCTQEGQVLKVCVKDQGIGIDEQDSKKLFQRFFRVENLETKTISGFGIGLYLCAEIIRRHHGEIGVESKAGQGSTFYFTLPLA
eukprot:gene11888-13853_t